MIRTLALIKRHPAIERSAFRNHYENVHVPLALSLPDGLRNYVRHHVERGRFGDFEFDVLTAFGYRDKAATDRTFARIDVEAGSAIREDESGFMDRSARGFFAVSERSLLPGDEGETHLFVLVSRPRGMSRYENSANLVKDHWPRLLARQSEPNFALLRDLFPVQGSELPYDCVMQLGASEFAGVESWSRSLEAEGYGICAVEALRFETEIV